jgi:hypothetical protein
LDVQIEYDVVYLPLSLWTAAVCGAHVKVIESIDTVRGHHQCAGGTSVRRK